MWQESKISKPKIEQQSQDNIIKNIRNLCTLKKENKSNQEEIILTKLFWTRRRCLSTRVRVSNVGDRNKNLSSNEYLDKIKPYLKILWLIFKNPTHKKFN